MAAIDKLKAVAGKVKAAQNACGNCGKLVKSTNRKKQYCSKTCEGAMLHKIMNGHV